MKTVFLRVLEADDKAAALLGSLGDPERARNRQRFEVDPTSFRNVPGSPFAYWVTDAIRRLFSEFPPFERDGRTAKQGLTTADDFRFVRAWWEVQAQSLSREWFPFVKGGEYLPFYADIHLVVGWALDGREMKAWADPLYDNSGWSRIIKSTDLYFRPGLTWPLRAVGLSMSPVPRGVIFSARGYLATGPEEDLLKMLGLMNSRPFEGLFRVSLSGLRPEFIVGVLNTVPFPSFRRRGGVLAAHTRKIWSLKRSIDTGTEISHAFSLPALLQVDGKTVATRVNRWSDHLRSVNEYTSIARAALDDICLELYGIDEADRHAITGGFDGNTSDPGSSADPDYSENDVSEVWVANC